MMKYIFLGGPLHLTKLEVDDTVNYFVMKNVVPTMDRNTVFLSPHEYVEFLEGVLDKEKCIKYISSSPAFEKKYKKNTLSKYDEYILAHCIYEKCIANKELFKNFVWGEWMEIKNQLTPYEIKNYKNTSLLYTKKENSFLRVETKYYYTIPYYSCLDKLREEVFYSKEITDLYLGYT